MKHLHITIHRKAQVISWRIGERSGSDPMSASGCFSATLGEIIRCALPPAGGLSVEIHDEHDHKPAKGD